MRERGRETEKERESGLDIEKEIERTMHDLSSPLSEPFARHHSRDRHSTRPLLKLFASYRYYLPTLINSPQGSPN